MFWEKAEHDDKNPNAAFHHRKTFEKMTLRKQQKVDLETYKKFYEFRDQQFKVLDLLKDIFKRETKKTQILEHDRAIMNLEYKLLQGEKTKIANPITGP